MNARTQAISRDRKIDHQRVRWRRGPMGRGGPMGMMKGEKARDFKGTMRNCSNILERTSIDRDRHGFCDRFHCLQYCRPKDPGKGHHQIV